MPILTLTILFRYPPLSKSTPTVSNLHPAEEDRNIDMIDAVRGQQLDLSRLVEEGDLLYGDVPPLIPSTDNATDNGAGVGPMGAHSPLIPARGAGIPPIPFPPSEFSGSRCLRGGYVILRRIGILPLPISPLSRLLTLPALLRLMAIPIL